MGVCHVEAAAAGAVPLILKANNANGLAAIKDEAITATVRDALELGCSAIGYTIYPGSDRQYEMFEEVRAGAVNRAGDRTSISPQNLERYALAVRTLEAVNSERLVGLYVRYYPLFQEAYKEQGYPNAYFNDRLVEALDVMIRTPESPGQLALSQPKVLYEFADPALEGLPAGQKVMLRMGLKEDDIIESPLVSKQIANAQRKVEAHNFDIRKNLLDFDDVNNDQRKVIYQQRNELLEADSVHENIEGIRADVVADTVRRFVPENSIDEQWDLPGLEAELAADFGLAPGLAADIAARSEVDAEQITEEVQQKVAELFAAKEQQVGPETMRAIEKHVMLSVLDDNWKQHLARMDYLRQGIYLRGYAQKQPKQEYKHEAFELFGEMLDKVKREVVTLLARVRIRSEEEVAAMEAAERAQAQAQSQQLMFQHADAGGLGADEEAQAQALAFGIDRQWEWPTLSSRRGRRHGRPRQHEQGIVGDLQNGPPAPGHDGA